LTCVFRPVSVLISQRQTLSLSGWKSALLDTPLTPARPEAPATISLTCPSRVGLCWRERSHPRVPTEGARWVFLCHGRWSADQLASR
jgi:hypothetical protein